MFEDVATQIERQSGGAWNASRGVGTDGSAVFLGRQGEGLVAATDGRLYRGAIGRGIEISAQGLRPDYVGLTPID